MMNREQIAIMEHTEKMGPRGMYCGDSYDMRELVAAGLMESAGRKSFVPDEYFRITAKGREALRANAQTAS